MTSPLTVYVDPGVIGSSISVFTGTELFRAAYVPNTVGTKASPLARRVYMARALREWLWSCVGACTVASLGVEDPQVLDARHQKGSKAKADPNDLLNLTGVTAALGALLDLPPEAMRSLKPREWKDGNVDKFVMNARVWGRLTPEERARIDRRDKREPGGQIGLDHNTLDAVGIGLYCVGRLERVRVFAP